VVAGPEIGRLRHDLNVIPHQPQGDTASDRMQRDGKMTGLTKPIRCRERLERRSFHTGQQGGSNLIDRHPR
jgi:hypothetical protein